MTLIIRAIFYGLLSLSCVVIAVIVDNHLLTVWLVIASMIFGFAAVFYGYAAMKENNR